MSVFPEMLNICCSPLGQICLLVTLWPTSDNNILHCLKAACISFRYSGREASDNNSLDKAIFYLNIDTFVG